MVEYIIKNEEFRQGSEMLHNIFFSLDFGVILTQIYMLPFKAVCDLKQVNLRLDY